MTRILPILSCGLVFCLASPAFAEKPLSAGAKEKIAKKACAAGDYAKGVDLLADLYVESNDLAYVYNQARCYQQNGRWEQAILRFREYLRKAKDISEADRAEAEQQIQDCELLIGKTSGKTSQVAPPSVAVPSFAPAPQPETRPQVVEADTSLASSKPEASPSDSGSGLRVAGAISAIVGVAAIGTGVGLNLKANGLSTADYSRSREDDRSSLKTWGWVSYGVGAAAIATGVVLYVVGLRSAEQSRVALLPAVAPDGASVSLTGRF